MTAAVNRSQFERRIQETGCLEPPPPNFGRREDLIPGDSGCPIVVDSTSPVNSKAETNHVFVTEPPTSPDPLPPCSPVNTPSSSPPVSPSRERCESPVYIPLQDHQYALSDYPLPNSPTLNGSLNLGMNGEVFPANSVNHQRPRPRVPRPMRRAPSPSRSTARSHHHHHHHQRPDQRRRAPFLPRTTAMTSSRSPYARPRQPTFSNHTFPRARNLFQYFISTFPPLVNTFPAPPAPAPPAPVRDRSPSPDVLLEVNSYTRHPLDPRKHLTI